MKLKLKRQRDGELRPRWYGRYKVDNREKEIPLCKWRGTPPESGSVADEGDKAFEASRNQALAEMREIVEGERSEADRQALAARVHRARYGAPVRRVKIAELFERWREAPKKGTPSKDHEAVVRGVLDRFVEYMKQTAPRVTETGALTAEHFRGFMDAEKGRGISPRTWNGELSILRGIIRRVDPHSSGYVEYLKELPKQDENPVHRKPFTAQELDRIFDAARGNPIMRGIIIAAASTAMRRGDVARLRWESVDLVENFVTVKTAKTGETVDIPIFPLFRQELESRKCRGTYVFPEAAKLYETAPDKLDKMLRAILEKAGFVRPSRRPGRYPPASPEEIRKRAGEAIDRAGWTPRKTAAVREVLERHLKGKTGKGIARALKISPATVSAYLNELESMTETAIVGTPADPEADPTVSTLAEIPPDAQRKQRGSLRGWHSFRTTWTTLALSNGVPMEIVRKITGHRTAEIVMKNYFRPDRAAIRAAIGDRMPRALIGKAPAAEIMVPAAEVRALVETLTPKNAAKVRAQLLKMLEG
jgi:integrase